VRTQLQKVSKWIEGTEKSSVPPDVLRLAKYQLCDCIAAICAGARSDVGIKLRNVFKNSDTGGNCTVIPFGDKWSIENALYFHTAMINALELDNFVFMGHVSQSAFMVPLSLGEIHSFSIEEILIAAITAQEVAGRLSAYLVSGPHQGHMRAFLHRISAAVAVSKLLKYKSEVIARALAIALSMPEFPLYPACFSPDTKVICTSSPTIQGMKAAFFAKEGLDGPLDIIENPIGFFAYFSYASEVPDIWKYLGKTWSIYSLSIKKYATCAYAQGPSSAALKLRQKVEFNIEEVAHIVIRCPIVTMVLEKFAKPHFGASITPVNCNFSTIRSVAATLLYGELSGDFFAKDSFHSKISKIEMLSNKIHLKHDWSMTIKLLRGIDEGIANAGMHGFLSLGNSKKTFKRFKKAFGSRPLLTWKDIGAIGSVDYKDLKYFIKRYFISMESSAAIKLKIGNRSKWFSHEEDLKRMKFCLSGKVEITLEDGNRLEEACFIPAGFAGSPDIENEIKYKFMRETTPLWGEQNAQKIFQTIVSHENIEIVNVLEMIHDFKVLNHLK
jgi:2-methylcitrate dehydratase PrpD